jgi:hypothetical protein
MTKIICPEPGSQLTIGSVTAPMTEPTPRTDKFREAEKEAAGPFEIAKVLNWTLDSHESLEHSLARKEALLRDIEAAMRSPGTNMVGLQTLLKRIERELKG